MQVWSRCRFLCFWSCRIQFRCLFSASVKIEGSRLRSKAGNEINFASSRWMSFYMFSGHRIQLWYWSSVSMNIEGRTQAINQHTKWVALVPPSDEIVSRSKVRLCLTLYSTIYKEWSLLSRKFVYHCSQILSFTSNSPPPKNFGLGTSLIDIITAPSENLLEYALGLGWGRGENKKKITSLKWTLFHWFLGTWHSFMLLLFSYHRRVLQFWKLLNSNFKIRKSLLLENVQNFIYFQDVLVVSFSIFISMFMARVAFPGCREVSEKSLCNFYIKFQGSWDAT